MTSDTLNDFENPIQVEAIIDSATTHQPRPKKDETVGATTGEMLFIAGFFLVFAVLVLGGIAMTIWGAVKIIGWML